jgi:hypothetical protein
LVVPLSPGGNAVTSPQDKKPDPLQPLLFLEGTWHGDGKGPHGPYDFDFRVERRGRWLLLTMSIFQPKTDTVFYVSTQVFGYDDSELTLHLFDTAGVFEFRGQSKGEGVRFEWKQGESSKRSAMRPQEGGTIYARYESYVPPENQQPETWEWLWLPGKRRLEKTP